MTNCLNCSHEDERGFLFCPKCGTKAPEEGTPADPLIGRTLNGKYRVLSILGSGAMGTVYTGEHVGLKKRVALKVLHADLLVSDEQLQRFQREGIAAGKFSHPNAIQIFDFDKSEDGTIYLAMEFVAGSTLKEYVGKAGKLSIAVAIQLTRQVLACLAEAHRVGIIHRDLKPDNIMVVPGSRGEVRIKVLDFGLSKLVDLGGSESSLVTQVGRILGTPLYMSPEQCSGDETDSRSDLYAVGLMLFEMIAGRRPFQEESTSDLLFARATSEAPSMLTQDPECGIPLELDAVLLRSMSRRREDRYQLADDMMLALEAVPLSGSSWNVSGTSVMTSTEQLERHRSSLKDSAQEHLAESSIAVQSGGGLRILGWGLGLAALAGLAIAGTAFGIFSLGGGEDPVQQELPAEVAVEPEQVAPLRASQLLSEDRSVDQKLYVQSLEFARQSLDAGHPEQARTSINRALLSPAADSEANLLEAEMFVASGDLDAAAASFEEALTSDPNYLEAILGQGWLALEKQRYQAATDSFSRALELAPENPEALAAKGVAALRMGDAPAAEELLNQALTLDERNPVALTFRGRLLLDSGDTVRAIDSLVAAKRNDPSSWRAPAWLGNAYLVAGREGDAELQWKEALALRDGVELRRNIATLMVEGGRFGEAGRFLEEAQARFPRDAKLFALRGLVEFEAGRLSAARGSLRQAVDAGVRDGKTRTLLASLLHGEGLLPEAIDLYERVIEDIGDFPSANVGLGIAYFESQKYAAAAACFQKVLEYDPRHLGAHLNLGILHMEYLDNPDDLQRAREHFSTYQSLGGDDARVSDWLKRL